MAGTEQEEFWRGAFGDAYVERSQGPALVAARTALWARILKSCAGIETVTEFGANIGLNLRAMAALLPEARFTGIEINAGAARQLAALERVTAIEGSMLDVAPEAHADLAFTCTVLIHINPERLPDAYARLAGAARRYAVICEYYNPSPVEVAYRGHAERLFKRDFAGEFMDAHPAFRLRDYGFVYHRDPTFPADDFTWFLMERG